MKGIYNVKIVKENKILEGMAVLFDSKIQYIIREEDIDNFKLEKKIDGKGLYLGPGFIDIHIHGCMGCDSMDEDSESIDKISMELPKTGVTSFLATTMTMSIDRIKKALKNIKSYVNKTSGANLIGCHLEGPFISPEFKGAQDEGCILKPDFSVIEDFKDIIKIVTMAPEIEGSCEFIEKCVENNIIVSIGHTGASYEKAVESVKWGASQATHTFNAMTGMNHRKPGVVGAAMTENVLCQLITDNIHVHPAAQKILYKVKGSEGILLITDAMMACMMENGRYELGGQPVIVNNGEARLENGTLAGSVLTLNKGALNFSKNTGANIPDTIKMASLNQAKALHIDDRKGRIEAGMDADIILFDNQFNIYSTYILGIEKYRRG